MPHMLASHSSSLLLSREPDRFISDRNGQHIDVYFESSPVLYPDAVAAMQARVEEIVAGQAPEALWFLEHPPLYTAGTSARDGDILERPFPVYHTGRGGQMTYHGPGQRVVYVMLDLRRRGRDVRSFVAQLETWVIAALAEFQISGYLVDGRVGVWVKRPDKPAPQGCSFAEDKIAAVGVRIKKWVTFHGICLNVEPDLTHYRAIVPCGIRDQGVTSLADLGIMVSLEEVDCVLIRTFQDAFSSSA